MKYLLDTNILLRRIVPAHPQHAVTLTCLRKLREADSSLFVTTQNLSEFWNVCTRPAENNGLGLSVAEAAFHLKGFERLFIRLVDNEHVYSHWSDLVISRNVMGSKVHDAKLVASMLAHEIDNLLTFNTKDFKRYSEIDAIDPTEA